MERAFSKTSCHPNPSRLAGIGLLALFLALLLAAIFPKFHRAIHSDAGRPNHRCAVTLVLSGCTEAPASFIHITGSEFRDLFIAKRTEGIDILAVFLCGHIAEHAPPAVS
jgi:hypothetical protein